MKVRADKLQKGQRIRIEYGDYGNWMGIMVEEVRRFRHMVVATFHIGAVQSDVSFQPDEQVEVLEEDA